MSRPPRELSNSGFYHIVFRGINHCHIFEESEDYLKFLSILDDIKESMPLELYAYCLMGNHAHLLIKEKSSGDIICAMRKLLAPYAYWFNKKYQRSGALIGERYRSECVESDEYLLVLIRYIHKNPLKAGIAEKAEDYRWSSYHEYLGQQEGICDTKLVLGMFSDDLTKAHRAFKAFHLAGENEEDHSLFGTARKSEEQISKEIREALSGTHPNSIGALDKSERNALLLLLREKGFSIRQIERATGVSRGIIQRCT